MRWTGTWQQYRCIPTGDDPHYFSLLIQDDGAVLSSVTVPPKCTEPADTAVTRSGSQGRGATKRQRYLCVPKDGTAPHYFTPPGREAVAVGRETCATCHDLLTPHQGEMAASRASNWTLRDDLFGRRPDRRINDWARNHPEIAGHMAWLVVEYERTHNRRTSSVVHYAKAATNGLDRIEPRLATISFQTLLASRGHAPGI